MKQTTDAAIQSVIWLVVIIVIIIAIVAVLVTLTIAKGITRPLSVLAEQAAQICQEVVYGRLDARADVTKVAEEFQPIIKGVNALTDAAVSSYDNIESPIMIIDRDFKVQYMNKAGKMLAGGDPRGRNCCDIFNNGDCNTKNCALSKAMQEGKACKSTTVARLSNGVVMPIAYTGAPLRDAKGSIIGAIEVVTDQSQIYKVAKAVDSTVAKVSQVTTSLAALAEQLGRNVDDLVNQSNMVAGSAEEITVSVSTVASGAEEAATGVATMAEGTSQVTRNINEVSEAMAAMNQAIGEISRNTAQGAAIADEAAQKTDTTFKLMEELAKISGEISNFIKTISAISGQTNLLALNATIEAARSGEAGKGFAVVAAEVKELANATKQATEQMTAQVETIQKSAEEAMKAITAVRDIIDKTREISQIIASSVEEQSSTVQTVTASVGESAEAARTVASNSEEVSTSVKEIARSSNDSSAGVQEVSKSINDIREVCTQVGEGSKNVNVQAESLRKEVSTLQTVLKQFDLLDKL